VQTEQFRVTRLKLWRDTKTNPQFSERDMGELADEELARFGFGNLDDYDSDHQQRCCQQQKNSPIVKLEKAAIELIPEVRTRYASKLEYIF